MPPKRKGKHIISIDDNEEDKEAKLLVATQKSKGKEKDLIDKVSEAKEEQDHNTVIEAFVTRVTNTAEEWMSLLDLIAEISIEEPNITILLTSIIKKTLAKILVTIPKVSSKCKRAPSRGVVAIQTPEEPEPKKTKSAHH